jgi:hypothetical protein
MATFTYFDYLNLPHTEYLHSLASFDTGAAFSTGPRAQVEELYRKLFTISCDKKALDTFGVCAFNVDILPYRVAMFNFGRGAAQVSIQFNFDDLVELDGTGFYKGKITAWGQHSNRNDWLLGVDFLEKVYAIHKVKTYANGHKEAFLALPPSRPC